MRFSDNGSTCIDCEDLYALYSDDQDTQLNLYIIRKADNKLVHMLKEKFNVFTTLNLRYLELSHFIDEIVVSIDQETNSVL